VRALLLVSVVMVAVSCGEEPEAPLPPVTQKKKVEQAAPVEAVSEIDYVYNPVGKRDPFRGAVMDTKPNREEQGDVPVGCSEPLCMVDLDELRVVAVVSGDANPLAMVEDRTGVGHIVRRNTKMGRAGGKVTQVLRECIVVTSFVSGGADGKPVAKKDELCVAADERSQPQLDLLKNKDFAIP
jgi:type IV pilus assembly protein PilP